MQSLQAQARDQTYQLIEKYEALGETGRHQLNEADTRRTFILPLFAALGWDTNDATEVAEEVRVGKTYADYAFRLSGVTRFFVEGKAIRVDLEEIRWAEQAVSYAYNKGVPWSVLTDFEGLKLFNAEWDVRTVNHLRVLDLHYTRYIDEFDDLWALSKPSVMEDGLRRTFEERGGAVKKREPVDERLFGLFKEWRLALMNLFVQYQPPDTPLRLGEIDEAVQRILDRLVFIRTLEDRRIEDPILWPIYARRQPPPGQKPSGPDAWMTLRNEFGRLDEIYDSIIFKTHLADELEADESVFLPIMEQLYSPDGSAIRFDFSAIEADVLGKVYEQYLGHVLETTKNPETREGQLFIPGMQPANAETVDVIAKRAKRKQQGIYYTPKYIVDYIVEQTLGRLLEERGDDPNFLENLTVLDPACGSGSFLIAAYQRLLEHYAQLWDVSPEELEPEERINILTRHIYGVDLDPQAVEIARLNLLLKALKEPLLLPELATNIVRGNSLISGDAETLEGYFGPGWREKHPLNWEERFPGVMGRGGFDVVIGNPPYGAKLTDEEKAFYTSTFIHQDYQLDTYMLFMERCIGLLPHDGFWGMIIPNPWLTNLKTKSVRRFMFAETSIWNIVHYRDKVFPDATVDVEIVVARKQHKEEHRATVAIASKDEALSSHQVAQQKWRELDGDPVNIFIDEATYALLDRVRRASLLLKDVCKVTVGMKPYQTGKGKPPQTKEVVENRVFDATDQLDDTYRAYLRGSDIARYLIKPIEERWISYGEWLAEPRPSANFDAAEKLLMRQTGDSPIVALDTEQHLCMNNLHVIELTNREYNIRFILGLLNSRLNDWYYEMLNPEKGEALAEVKKANVERLLIRAMDFSKPDEVRLHDQVVAHVEALLSLHKHLVDLPETEERTEVERQIAEEDAALDALVYKLYGLTEEEIAVVEAAA